LVITKNLQQDAWSTKYKINECSCNCMSLRCDSMTAWGQRSDFVGFLHPLFGYW